MFVVSLLMLFASYFHFQKIIQSYVKTPILHCYFGTLHPADIDAKAKYVYILRRGATKIGSFNVDNSHTNLTHIDRDFRSWYTIFF